MLYVLIVQTGQCFFFDDDDLDRISDKVTGYINYSVESVSPRKHFFFSNNKTCVTREVKSAINRKKSVFVGLE